MTASRPSLPFPSNLPNLVWWKKEEMTASTERAYIHKTVRFPVEVKPEAAKANLRNGILEVMLPKAEIVKKVKIEVKPL